MYRTSHPWRLRPLSLFLALLVCSLLATIAYYNYANFSALPPEIAYICSTHGFNRRHPQETDVLLSQKGACDILQYHAQLWARQLAKLRMPKTVALTCSSSHYKDTMIHWNNMVKRFGIELGINVAMDTETCQVLESNNLPHLCVRPDNPLPPNLQTVSVKIAICKLLAPVLILHMGSAVLFSELDVFWKRPPLEDLDAPENLQYDFQVSSHSYHSEINIGFFYARPTGSAKVYFNKMLSYFTLHAWFFNNSQLPVFDQKLFDNYLRGLDVKRSGTTLPRNLTPIPEYFPDLPHHHMKYKSLPYAQYPHYAQPDELRKEGVQNVVFYHIWSGAGTWEARMKCAYELGLLHDPSVSYLIDKPCFPKECCADLMKVFLFQCPVNCTGCPCN